VAAPLGALALLRQRLKWLVGFALALWWQRLGFAPALVRRRLELLLTILQRRLYFAPSLALCPGCQRLGLSGGGSFSLASGSDAGGPPGQGWCSAHDRQRSPSFVRINARGFKFPRIRVRDHACKPKTVKVSGAAMEDR